MATTSGSIPNAVDFILQKFPPEEDLNSNEQKDLIKQDIDALAEIDNEVQKFLPEEDSFSNEPNDFNKQEQCRALEEENEPHEFMDSLHYSECSETSESTDDKMEIDPELGGSHRYTLLNVSILFISSNITFYGIFKNYRIIVGISSVNR